MEGHTRYRNGSIVYRDSSIRYCTWTVPPDMQIALQYQLKLKIAWLTKAWGSLKLGCPRNSVSTELRRYFFTSALPPAELIGEYFHGILWNFAEFHGISRTNSGFLSFLGVVYVSSIQFLFIFVDFLYTSFLYWKDMCSIKRWNVWTSSKRDSS